MSLTTATPAAAPHRGHGRRLVDAIEALDDLPAFVESRDDLVAALSGAVPHHGRAIAAIESDVTLTVSVLRLAGDASRNAASRRRPDTVVAAVDLLSDASLMQLAQRVRTFDVCERASLWGSAPDQLRVHAVATQGVADRIARELHFDELDRDRLRVASLLHDIGRLVLLRAFPEHDDRVQGAGLTPQQRTLAERTHLGVDHTMVAGVLARRWGIPASLARGIEHHHRDDVVGVPRAVNLADAIVHYAAGHPIDPRALAQSAKAIGMDERQLRAVMASPHAAPAAPRSADPCPLSKRELAVLRELATGKVYKQIADTMGLSRSTIRSHLHNVYAKVGAADRAQAVLIATDHGWI